MTRTRRRNMLTPSKRSTQAYKLKFAVKKAAQVDYVVPPLEGLWWAEDMDTFTHARDKSAWDWTMMIMTPDWATPDLYEQAIAEVTAKKDLPRCPNYAWKATTKGCRRRSCTSARTTTKGLSWRLHNEWLPANGYEETGKHHEIYLSDPRRGPREDENDPAPTDPSQGDGIMNRPNIIYIHSHDTGRYVQPYGYQISTPRIQQLAEQGVLFRQAFCAAPTCSPSRAALLTGQSPHNAGMTGLVNRGWGLNDNSQHLLHTLRAAGYLTVLGGLQHVAFDPNSLGFDVNLSPQDTKVENVAPGSSTS
ncbi:MAG: sulfatase-like hydrolase/transferase [Caldilineaceae bacterium]